MNEPTAATQTESILLAAMQRERIRFATRTDKPAEKWEDWTPRKAQLGNCLDKGMQELLTAIFDGDHDKVQTAAASVGNRVLKAVHLYGQPPVATEPQDTEQVAIADCSACGGVHYLPLLVLETPEIIRDRVFKHMYYCPTNGMSVYVRRDVLEQTITTHKY